MIYIIEGIDRVGKSTLALQLQKRTGAAIYHDKHKPMYITMNSDDDYIGIVEECMVNDTIGTKFATIINFLKLFDNAKQDLIIDRLHLTERVYNNHRGLKFNNYDLIDYAISQLNTLLILVLPMDINESSRQHGSDLTMHNRNFIKLYNDSVIKNKDITLYAEFDKLVDKIGVEYE